MNHPLKSKINYILACWLKASLFVVLIGIEGITLGQENKEEQSIESEIEDCLEKKICDSVCFERFDKLFLKYYSSDFDKAVEVANNAIKFAKKVNNDSILIFWYGKISEFYIDYELYPIALENIKLALQISKEKSRKHNWWLINIGNIYFAEEIYDEAFNYYNLALANFSNSKTKNDTLGIGVTFLNIAMIYEKENNLDSSLFYYKKSIAIYDSINDYYRMAYASLHLSNLFLSTNIYDSTTYYLDKATEYNRLSSDVDILHLIHEKRGDLFAKLGMYDKAMKSYDMSLSISKSFNITKNLIRVHDKKAKVYTLLKDMTNAIKQYKLSLAYAHKTNNIKRLVELNKQISESYYYKLNIDSAYHYLWKYANWKDSLDQLNLKVTIHSYAKENELQKIDLLQKELALEKGTQFVYKYLIVAALIIFVGLIAFLIFVIKSKKKLKKQHVKILEQNSTISSQVEEIIQQNDLLNTYKNNLEKIVDEKTKHLEIALKRAEESDLLKTAFLTNMSHEIRTPMNAVLGFGSLLSNSKLDEASRIKYTEVLIKSTEELHKVINSIVELSKIESGQIDINKTFFDINILFQELMLLFSKQLFETSQQNLKIEFTNQLPTDRNMIVADRSIIKQVMINLIDNAIKFTKIGGVLFGCKMSTNNSLEFFVKDTGSGIHQKDFDTIFKRFRQLEIKEKQKNKGIGLGLPISRGLVDKLNGTLYVESKKGKGSKFYFIIPFEVHKQN